MNVGLTRNLEFCKKLGRSLARARRFRDQFCDGDNVLVHHARKGDRGAFEELVARHRDKVFTRAFNIMRNVDEAMDLSQKAWVQGWQQLSRFHGDLVFSAWMTRIVIRLCLDQLREQKPQPDEPVCKFDEKGDGCKWQIQAATANSTGQPGLTVPGQCMDHALGRLSHEHRAVLVLRELEKMKYKEIAWTMGCSIDAVMSKLLYARRKIAALVNATNGGQ